jgi:hypothetical protein
MKLIKSIKWVQLISIAETAVIGLVGLHLPQAKVILLMVKLSFQVLKLLMTEQKPSQKF